MVHIIALEDEPTSLRGGQQLNLFEICHGLSERGHQITLLYGREGNLLEHYRHFCDRTIPIHRYGFDRRKIGQFFDFLPNLAKIPTIPSNKDTVVFSNSCHPAFFARLLAFYKKSPLICYIQSPSMDFNKQKLIGLKGTNRFITVSHQLKHYWTQLGYAADRVEVVHNGTNLARFRPVENLAELRAHWGISEATKVIGYVGRLDKEKGVDVLLKAFALLSQKEDVRLVLAGKSVLGTNLTGQDAVGIGSTYEDYLKQLTVELGIEKSVHFLGYLKDTAAVFQASDITVVPSLWDEPFGRVIIESMACGTPVMASRVGGIPEILTEEFQEFLVNPGDERELARALQTRLNWKDKDPDLGDRARQHVLNQFSLEQMVDGIEKAILKVKAYA